MQEEARVLRGWLTLALLLPGLAAAGAWGDAGSGRALPPALAPAITVQPRDAAVAAGQAAHFSVTATGTPPLAYQWQRDGSAIAGATGADYTTPAATLADHGARFSVVVANAAGSVTSDPATLAVSAAPEPPAITAQPRSVTVAPGQSARFSVTARGTAPLAYQWRVNGLAIAGATAASYATPAAAPADNGARYTVAVANPVGSLVSAEAVLTVAQAPPAPVPLARRRPHGFE